jgi:hypothetical protein
VSGRHLPPYPAFHWLRWGLTSFLSRLALNCASLYLCHLSSQDYWQETTYSAEYLFWFFSLEWISMLEISFFLTYLSFFLFFFFEVLARIYFSMTR